MAAPVARPIIAVVGDRAADGRILSTLERGQRLLQPVGRRGAMLLDDCHIFAACLLDATPPERRNLGDLRVANDANPGEQALDAGSVLLRSWSHDDDLRIKLGGLLGERRKALVDK